MILANLSFLGSGAFFSPVEILGGTASLSLYTFLLFSFHNCVLNEFLYLPFVISSIGPTHVVF